MGIIKLAAMVTFGSIASCVCAQLPVICALLAVAISLGGCDTVSRTVTPTNVNSATTRGFLHPDNSSDSVSDFIGNVDGNSLGGSTVKGFWYAPFSSGGQGGMCIPSSGNIESAPGSGSYDMAAFFWGLMPSAWCTGSNADGAYIDYLTINKRLKFPGSVSTEASNWVPITNAFAGQSDDFQFKVFTIGGGDESSPWTADEIGYLTSGCGADSSGKVVGLIDLLRDVGYNGIMLDYEYEQGNTVDVLKAMITGFKQSYPKMTLSFTMQGNPTAGLTTPSLVNNVLSETTDHWEFAVPQLYDAQSCTYADQYIQNTAQLFNSKLPASKVLLGMVQGVPLGDAGCNECRSIKNGGIVEYFYRPQTYTQ